MARRPSLVKQVCDTLYKQERFGESKYEEKQKERERCLDAGERWNPARVNGIFSVETMRSYRKNGIAFVEWAKKTHRCRWLDECKTYVAEYLQIRIDANDSASTIFLRRCALRKIYQDPLLGEEVKLPVRRQSDVIRSRGPKKMDRELSISRNRDLIDFCKATGLRRHEGRALFVGDIFLSPNGLKVNVRQGKGGKPRTVDILLQYQARILEMIDGREPEELLFPRIPIRLDVHGYRREYAQDFYKQVAGAEYDKNNPNEAAVLETSRQLGHNRSSVAKRSYLQ